MNEISRYWRLPSRPCINRLEQKSTFSRWNPPLIPLWRKLIHPILLNSLISVMMSWMSSPNFGGESPLFNRGASSVLPITATPPMEVWKGNFIGINSSVKMSSWCSKFSNLCFSYGVTHNTDVNTYVDGIQNHFSHFIPILGDFIWRKMSRSLYQVFKLESV